MRKSFALILCFLSIVYIGCTDDLNNQENTGSKGQIHCNVIISDQFLTKGTPVNNASDPEFNTIGILGYHTSGKFSSETNATSTFLPNVQVKKSGTNTWNFDRLYYWPQNGYVSFFAYAPYANTVNGIKILNNQNSSPVLSYSVPHKVADQPDLMIATPQIDIFREDVNLNFSHALACIGFDVSGENVPIDSIGIRGVYTDGTLMLNMASKNPVWSSLSGINNTFYKVGLINDPVATNPSTGVMATNGYLMMIPQQLSDDAAIIVKFRGIDAKVIPLKNAGTSEWIAGNKYMYSLKEGVYNLSVIPSNTSIDYQGGTFGLTINSTYTKQNGSVENMGWTAKIIKSSNGDSTWIKGMEDLLNQTGGVNITKSLRAGISQYSSMSSLDNYLQQQPVIKKENMKDLSFVAGHYSSSNCYVVNGPGWYKFPCWIMGNGLNSSSSSAYTTSGSALNGSCFKTSAPYFVDYKGNNITNVQDLILNTSGASAELLWMDALQLVTDISLTPDNQYISFYVDSTTIRQGNALIALKNTSGEVMWSWHIWVNAWNLKPGDYKGNVMFFGNNIGVCYPATYNYPDQSVTIQFTQQQSNMTTEVTLSQTAEEITVYLNNPYYQWGRKDPMPGSYGNSAQTKPLYGPNGFVTFQIKSGPVSMSEAIRNPNVFYTSDSDWNTATDVFTWGNPVSSDYTKTIYDPSPVSLIVSSYDMLKVLQPKTWNDAFAGLGFVYNYDGGLNTIYYMGIGERMGNTGLIGVNFYSNGFYWTNQSSGKGLFYNMNVTKTPAQAIFNTGTTATGMSIMPVQNKSYPN